MSRPAEVLELLAWFFSCTESFTMSPVLVEGSDSRVKACARVLLGSKTALRTVELVAEADSAIGAIEMLAVQHSRQCREMPTAWCCGCIHKNAEHAPQGRRVCRVPGCQCRAFEWPHDQVAMALEQRNDEELENGSGQ